MAICRIPSVNTALYKPHKKGHYPSELTTAVKKSSTTTLPFNGDVSFQYISLLSLTGSLKQLWPLSQAAPKQHHKFPEKGTFFSLSFLPHNVHTEAVGRCRWTRFTVPGEPHLSKKTLQHRIQDHDLLPSCSSCHPITVLFYFIIFLILAGLCFCILHSHAHQKIQWREELKKTGGVFHSWETGEKLYQQTGVFVYIVGPGFRISFQICFFSNRISVGPGKRPTGGLTSYDSHVLALNSKHLLCFKL